MVEGDNRLRMQPAHPPAANSQISPLLCQGASTLPLRLAFQLSIFFGGSNRFEIWNPVQERIFSKDKIISRKKSRFAGNSASGRVNFSPGNRLIKNENRLTKVCGEIFTVLNIFFWTAATTLLPHPRYLPYPDFSANQKPRLISRTKTIGEKNLIKEHQRKTK